MRYPGGAAQVCLLAAVLCGSPANIRRYYQCRLLRLLLLLLLLLLLDYIILRHINNKFFSLWCFDSIPGHGFP